MARNTSAMPPWARRSTSRYLPNATGSTRAGILARTDGRFRLCWRTPFSRVGQLTTEAPRKPVMKPFVNAVAVTTVLTLFSGCSPELDTSRKVEAYKSFGDAVYREG